MDPLRTNKKQINVLHLMAKRNQVEMARRCLDAVRADPARAINFVNNSSNIGESRVHSDLSKSVQNSESSNHKHEKTECILQ